MESPGALLRQARESKGLSLSQAAAMTRISRTMLKHLEQDRFEEFNAEVFVRGHLRNYAREVGADPEVVIHAYERASSEASSVKTSSRSARTRTPAAPAPKRAATKRATKPAREQASRGPRRSASWIQKIGPTHMVAVVLVLVGLLFFVSLLSGNRATAQDPAKFPTKSQDAWELERDVEQTRWLLEQPADQKSGEQ